MWKLDGNLRTIRTPDCGFFQLNGLFGQRAHLFANQAGLVVRPGNAAVLIDIGQTNNLLAFLFKGKRWNGLDRADLAAQVAGIVAVAQTRHQDGGTQPLQSGIEDRRLEPAGGTNPDAFVTACAFGESDHIRIRLTDTRRTDQVWRLAFGKPIAFQ